MMEQYNSKTLDEVISACRKGMMYEPFYGFVMLSLNKTTSTTIGTAGVYPRGLSVTFAVNPYFFDKLSDGTNAQVGVPYDHNSNQKWGVIKHELLHVCFGHLYNFQKLQKQNPDLANIAMDIAVNQYIKPSQLVEGACTLEYFNNKFGLNMRAFESAAYYYKKLKGEYDSNDAFQQLISEMSNDGNGQNDNDAGDVTKSKGVNGNNSQGKEGYEETKFDPNATPKMPNHDFSELDENGNKIEKNDDQQSAYNSAMESHIKGIMKQTAQIMTPGNIPGEMKQTIDELLMPKKSVVNWRAFMRRFVGNKEDIKIKQTRRIANKRIDLNPGFKLEKTLNILAACDTSASVSDKIVDSYMKELAIMHHKTNVNVDLLQFDHKIQDVSKFDEKKKVTIYGRGGTSFQEPFDYYKEHRREYDCFIILTDGEAYCPNNVFANARVLWIVYNESKESITEEMKGWPGAKVFVDNADLEAMNS